ncbi:TetR/AcrR family transcriptional regulator [Streptomonospora sediminis]
MTPTQGSRTGGRSARVQRSVHTAVQELLAERSRAELSVPLIAQRAGVTPSTVYRRWGDLQELLADVAVERLRPDAPPDDTGSLAGDLDAFAQQYLDETSSAPGREYLRDVLASDSGGEGNAGRFRAYCTDRIDVILHRAAERGEPAPAPDSVLDHVIAPMVYRILFAPATLTPEWATDRVHELMAAVADGGVGKTGGHGGAGEAGGNGGAGGGHRP